LPENPIPPRRLLGAIRPRGLGRAFRAARGAGASAAEMRNLHEFTRSTLQMNLSVKPGPHIAEQLHTLFQLDAVALFDADLREVYTAGKWSVDVNELAQNVYHFESSDDDPQTGISRRVIRLGSVPIGSLVLRGEIDPLTSSALAGIIAITFDRFRATANESRIEAEREAERMRATVLDSLAHAYKTPLTAIRAASSGLAEMGRLSAAQAELVSLIDEQAALLNELTNRLLTTARLESADVKGTRASLQLEQVPIASLIHEIVASLGERSAANEIRIEVVPREFTFPCDRRLVSMLLTQYLDNACKYSDAESPITVRAERSEMEVLLSVHSFGDIIPPADRERIFDRYYRTSAAATRAAGTGIGLSIAKSAAAAHGGSVWVAAGERGGNTFFAAFPISSAPSVAAPPSTNAERNIA
jgi:two-component system, OmpR family, sensor histidine kinase KdpD